MRRRQFLVAVVSGGSLALSGCVSKPDDERSARVTANSFNMVDASDTPDNPVVVSATPSKSIGTVVIEGTATVPDGCTVLALGVAPAFDEGLEVATMIGTRSEGDVCTQALEDIGYRLSFEYEGARPTTVRLGQAGTDSGTHILEVGGNEE